MPESKVNNTGFGPIYLCQRDIWHENCGFFFALYTGMPFLLAASSILCFKSSHPWWASLLTYLTYFFAYGVVMLEPMWINQMWRYYILKVEGPVPDDDSSVSERVGSSVCLVFWHCCFFNMIYFVFLVAAYSGSDL